MKHFFILGHNPELSKAEIFSFLEKQRMKFNSEFIEGGLVVDFEGKINIQELGGTKAIGGVLCEGDFDKVKTWIEKNEIYFGEKTNFTYFLSGNTDILDAIKQRLGKEKLKARYSSKIKSDFGWFYSDNYFGFIEQVYNNEDDERRDMKKPVRRSELAISPRLARILVNLTQVNAGEKILDCFCGIGVLLQEALLLGIDCVGIDIDKKAIFNCQKNLKWLEKEYNIRAKYKLLAGDSGKIKIERVQGIACEPSLGKLLKNIPSRREADEIINRFQRLMISVLNNVKHTLTHKRKIVFTSPLIRIQEGDLGIDIDYICDKTGLRQSRLLNVEFPILEAREKQIVSREIYVLSV